MILSCQPLMVLKQTETQPRRGKQSHVAFKISSFSCSENVCACGAIPHTQKNQLVSFRWVREDNGCQPTPTKLPKSQVNREVQVTWRKIGWGLDKAIGQRKTIRILITTFACREFNNNGSQGFKTNFAHLRKQNILYSDSLWQ